MAAIWRPERVVCPKNHKKGTEQAMLFLNVPVDREKVSLPRGIFCEVKKCTLLYIASPRNRSKFLSLLSTMASRLSVLQRLEDDGIGLYSEGESGCEAERISGYMPEDPIADVASGEALDDEEEDDDASSALTPGLVAGQYLHL